MVFLCIYNKKQKQHANFCWYDYEEHLDELASLYYFSLDKSPPRNMLEKRETRERETRERQREREITFFFFYFFLFLWLWDLFDLLCSQLSFWCCSIKKNTDLVLFLWDWGSVSFLACLWTSIYSGSRVSFSFFSCSSSCSYFEISISRSFNNSCYGFKFLLS